MMTEQEIRQHQSERSLLTYICDVMDITSFEKVSTLLKLAKGELGEPLPYAYSPWFLEQLTRFEGLKTIEEVRAASKQLRQDLL